MLFNCEYKIRISRGDRTMSKIQIVVNDSASTSGGPKEEFNSRLEFRIMIKDLEVLKQAIDVS